MNPHLTALQAIIDWSDITSEQWEAKYPQWVARYRELGGDESGADDDLSATQALFIEIARGGMVSRDLGSNASAATPKSAASDWDFDEGDLSIYAMDEGSPLFLFQPHELCDGDLIPWSTMVEVTRIATAAPTMLVALTEALRVMAMMVNPEAIKSSSVIHAYAQVVAAQHVVNRAILKATGTTPNIKSEG